MYIRRTKMFTLVDEFLLLFKSLLFEPTVCPKVILNSVRSTAVSFSPIHNNTSKRDLSCHAKISFTTTAPLSLPALPHTSLRLQWVFCPSKLLLQSHAGFTGRREAAIPGYQVDISCKHVVLYFVSALVAVSLSLFACPNHTLGAILCCCLGRQRSDCSACHLHQMLFLVVLCGLIFIAGWGVYHQLLRRQGAGLLLCDWEQLL